MAALMLAIGNKNYSSWSMRPWLALKAIGVEFDEVVIPLHEPGSKERICELSPAGKVPILKHGDITVWDSLAIIEYLAELPAGRALWPADAAHRARARSLAAEMHSGFMPLRSRMPMNIRVSFPARSRSAEVDGDIARIAQIWHDCRHAFGDSGPFLFGPFGAIDAMFAPVVTRFHTYGVRLDGVCRAYADAILAWPAMAEWYEAARAEPWSVARFDHPDA